MDLTFPIAIDSAGRMTTVDTHEETRQRIDIVLNTHQGDWDFDISYGVPWRQLMNQRPPDLVTWRGAIIQQIAAVPGVDSVDEITVVENADRTGTVTGRVTSSGTSIEIGG
jgi:hypothetical protein